MHGIELFGTKPVIPDEFVYFKARVMGGVTSILTQVRVISSAPISLIQTITP
jgi:hypothetical protein